MTVYLSPTTLERISSCGYAVYNEKVLGWKRKRTLPQVVGTSTHRVFMSALQAQARQASLSPEEVEDLASDSFSFEWHKAWDKGRLSLPEVDGTAASIARARGEATDLSILLAKKAARVLVPRIELEDPDDVEVPTTVRVRGSEVVIRGRRDFVERRKKRLSDFKTRAKRPAKSELAGSVALIFYALAAAKEGLDIREVGMDVITKTKVPKVYSLSTPAPTDYRPLLALVRQASRAFETGVFYPASQSGPQAWVCSEAHCDHFNRCPFGKARASVFGAVTVEEVEGKAE